MTTCCETAAEQSVQACLEYASLGFNRRSCKSWPRVTRAACHRYCGDRERMATAVKDICQFSLQVLNNGALTVQYCNSTYNQFKDYRWSVGCEFNVTKCSGDQGYPEGDTCMSECGNYAGCDCRLQRGTLLEATCDGVTVLRGPMPNRTAWEQRNWTCEDTPLKCHSNIEEGSKCNKYRLCPPDMCLIKNVSCPALDQCTLPGFCEKTEGICFYNDVPDGTPCDDEVAHTVRDVCIKGYCYGEPDYCLRFNVTCPTYSQCMSDGVCHPESGRCTYTSKRNAYPCDDGREFTVEDGCFDGLCRGRSVDLCVEQGMNCSDQLPNTCHGPGICDPQTGRCSLPVPISNQACDDADYTTVDDTCIDGLCVGYVEDWTDQRFETLGPGQCSDRSGRQPPSYAGDVSDEPECESLCKADRQCTAFSYAPPSCVLYGSIRTRPPAEAKRQWAWQGGSIPVAVKVEVALTVKGQRESVCRKKDEYGDTVLPQAAGKVEIANVFSFNVLLVFFFIILLLFCSGPIFRCWRMCLCGPQARKFCCCGPRKAPPVTETRLVDISPRDSDIIQRYDPEESEDDKDLRKVAQAPMQPLGDAPAAPPEDLPYGEPLTPSQALSPLTLPPTPGNLPGHNDTVSESGTSQASRRNGKWQRPVGRRKLTEDERAPPPSHNERVNDAGTGMGRNILGFSSVT